MRKDDLDDYMEYMMVCGEENSQDSSSGNVSSSDFFSGLFKVILGIIVVTIVLAIVFGIGVPGSVIGFFLKLILVAGMFAVISKL